MQCEPWSVVHASISLTNSPFVCSISLNKEPNSFLVACDYISLSAFIHKLYCGLILSWTLTNIRIFPWQLDDHVHISLKKKKTSASRSKRISRNRQETGKKKQIQAHINFVWCLCPMSLLLLTILQLFSMPQIINSVNDRLFALSHFPS